MPKCKELCNIFNNLHAEDKQTLFSFAEFLQSRSQPIEIAEPQIIPRVKGESIIAAIKRLSASYPMLDKSKLLHESSDLMTQHLMKGRDKNEVIDELELIFNKHYLKIKNKL
jgi:hypothetical protein